MTILKIFKYFATCYVEGGRDPRPRATQYTVAVSLYIPIQADKEEG